MTEKFYIVTEKSPLFKEYFDWKQNVHDVNEFVKEFMQKHGIESCEYSAACERFYIVPAESDRIKFLSQFTANELPGGLYAFKKNSSIGKAWTSELRAHNLSVKCRPFVPFHIKHSCGRSSSRIFDVNEILYMSFAGDGEFEAEEGIREIPGSEFYKVIEDCQKQGAES